MKSHPQQNIFTLFIILRVAGVEPASAAWKAAIIAVIRHPRTQTLTKKPHKTKHRKTPRRLSYKLKPWGVFQIRYSVTGPVVASPSFGGTFGFGVSFAILIAFLANC